MEGPRLIGELGAFSLHYVEIGLWKIVFVKHEPHMVECLRRVTAVLNGEVEQIERMLASALDDDCNLAIVRRA